MLLLTTLCTVRLKLLWPPAGGITTEHEVAQQVILAQIQAAPAVHLVVEVSLTRKMEATKAQGKIKIKAEVQP